MRRALVTLGHPDHAGMPRALKVLDGAGPRHGWQPRFVLAGARAALGGFAAGTRAHVLYNGVAAERIRREADAPLPGVAAARGRPRVGMVGNLDARKNPAVLIEALALVRAAIPDAEALLV